MIRQGGQTAVSGSEAGRKWQWRIVVGDRIVGRGNGMMEMGVLGGSWGSWKRLTTIMTGKWNSTDKGRIGPSQLGGEVNMRGTSLGSVPIHSFSTV
jgi:hypothetical protein